MPATVPPNRDVTCYHCGARISVPVKAMSLACRECQRRLTLEDLRIVATHPGRELMTCGTIVIEPTARLNIQRVVAENILVRGRVTAQVVARGLIEIAREGVVEGDVEAQRVIIREGGVLRGGCRIVAPPVPAAASPQPGMAGPLPPPPSVLTRPRLDV